MTSEDNRAEQSRRRATVLAVVAAGVLAVVTLLGGVLGGGDDEGATLPDSTGQRQVVATLDAAAAESAGRCMAPDAPGLQRLAQLAFAATAVEVDGARAVLEVDTAYLGAVADGDRVELRIPADRESAVSIEQGGRYLIAAADGAVIGCGFSGPDDERLAAKYDRAFAQ